MALGNLPVEQHFAFFKQLLQKNPGKIFAEMIG